MSKTLLKHELKSNFKLLVLFALIISLYVGVIISMYDPKLSESLNSMAESMPELFSLLGMQQQGNTLIDFLVTYLYGFILIIIPIVFSTLLAYKLITKYITNGSLSYLLNTTYSRSKILRTQIAVVLILHTILAFYTTTFAILVSKVLFPGELLTYQFIHLNISLFILHVTLSSILIFISTIFNSSKYAIGIGVGLCALFVLLQMLSQVTNQNDYLKYFTLLSLFNPQSIISNENISFIHSLSLATLTITLWISSIQIFTRKDLYL